MNSVSIGSLSLALLGGLLTILSPCVLPILPLIISRSFKTHRLGPAMLVAGLICGFATIGSLLGIASFWFVGFANLLRGIAIAALILLGLLSIFPRLSYQIFSRWQLGTSWQPAQPRLWGEFWIGTIRVTLDTMRWLCFGQYFSFSSSKTRYLSCFNIINFLRAGCRNSLTHSRLY
jgi:cytochrome c-type biogenesis protein